MPSVQVERLDHLGLIASTIKDLGLIDMIDARLVPNDQEAITAGEAVAGMILNGLGFANRPLSLTPRFLPINLSICCFARVSTRRCSIALSSAGHSMRCKRMVAMCCSANSPWLSVTKKGLTALPASRYHQLFPQRRLCARERRAGHSDHPRLFERPPARLEAGHFRAHGVARRRCAPGEQKLGR